MGALAVRRRLRRATAALLLAVVLAIAAGGCRALLEPFDEGTPGAAEASGAASLLRVSVCWPAVPLAEQISTALSADTPNLAVQLTRGDEPSPAHLLDESQADLAIVALPAEGAQPPTVPDAWESYRPVLLAIDALGVLVHTSSPLRSVSTEQLARLYGGYVLDWSALEAGSGAPEWVSTPAGAASRDLFVARVLGGEPPSSATVLVPNDRAVSEYVAAHPRALGFASMATLGEGVRVLALDGVTPTAANVARGDYAHTWALYALVSPSAPAAATAWIALATSSAGQELIAERYTLPD
ncbi:MAG: hypothetical protein GX557_13485 [Chloroflexi bacterium]|nr:hypothetical protein [Chloroflexota bacterium]